MVDLDRRISASSMINESNKPLLSSEDAAQVVLSDDEGEIVLKPLVKVADDLDNQRSETHG